MKVIEKATITKLNDNTFADKDDHVISIYLNYEDNSSQGTPGYRGNAYNSFITNIMAILNVEEKNQILGKHVLACTDFNRLFALGNQLGNEWIDLRNPSEIIKGDIIQYFEKQEDLER